MADPTWYAVCDSAGKLVSVGTAVADLDTLNAAGLTAIPLSGNPAGQVWNPNTKAFAAPPAKPNPTVIRALDFVKRFAPAEYQAMRASTDPQVAMFLLEMQFAPGGMVDLSTTDVKNGLEYLVSVNILTTARQTAIGTP